MTKIDLTINDMHCQKCVGRVVQALNSVEGVKDHRVAVGSAHVEFDEGKTSTNAIAEAVKQAGYDTQLKTRATSLPVANGCCCH